MAHLKNRKSILKYLMLKLSFGMELYNSNALFISQYSSCATENF